VDGGGDSSGLLGQRDRGL
jgi:hypothetical protein